MGIHITHYTPKQDDGRVTINSLVYPVVPVETRISNLVKKSTYNNTDIPRNYMTNLTYECGSARKFLDRNWLISVKYLQYLFKSMFVL